MGKPKVADPQLRSYMDKLYREGARVGSGSTADAVRFEAVTGRPVGGAWHGQKAKNMAGALGNWVKNNPGAAAADRAAAENVMLDLLNAASK
jgi:filamentous hemagglutinin